MRTDEFFYELFRFDPRLLIRLVGLELPGDWTYESVTVKTTEKPIDGLMVRTDGEGLLIFSEVQGYDDPAVYWRLLREISTWHEQQKKEKRQIIAIVIFLDAEDDPGFDSLSFNPPNRLVRAYLPDCLKALQRGDGALVVLRPWSRRTKKSSSRTSESGGKKLSA